MSTTHSTHRAIDQNGNSRSDAVSLRAGTARTIRRALFIKEAKQLAPLLIALLACALVLHFLGSFFNATTSTALHVPLMLLFPLLFALGAGPMLVSQEKEQRTLGWLGSLPVRRRSIVLTKLSVATLGLIFCWLVSVGFACLFEPSILSYGAMPAGDWSNWIGGTFLLMVTGFSLAWLLPTAVSSLIALLLAAFVTAALSGLTQKIADEYFWVESEFFPHVMIHYLIITVIFAAIAVRYGKSSFVAGGTVASPFSLPGLLAGLLPGRRNRLSRERSLEGIGLFRTQSQSSSLIWQIGRQNSLVWVALLTIVFMGLIVICFVLNFEPQEEFVYLILLLAGLVLSWLGASAFGSDSHRQRIRFLSDRGVAPGAVWWTRLILPLGCLAIGLLVFYLINWIVRSQYEGRSNSLAVPFEFVVTVTLGVLMVFAFTQWFSQWTRSTLLAFCVAPAAALFAIGYLIFAMEFLNVSLWLLLITLGTAMLATRIMMRPWMDGQFGLRYWISHCTLLMLAVVIPAIPFLITFATYPDMPSAMKRELEIEGEQYEDAYVKPILLGRRRRDSASSKNDASIASIESSNMVDALNDTLDVLEQQLLTTEGAILTSQKEVSLLGTETALMSIRLESGESKAEYRERYQRSIVLLSRVASRIRMSDRLFDQECADRIERWLVTDLLRPGRQEFLEEEVYAEVVNRLSDRATRHQARRRAVVFAWRRWQTGQDRNRFGGIQVPLTRTNSIAASWLVKERDIGKATEELLNHLEAKSSGSDQYPVKLRAYWPQSRQVNDSTLFPDIFSVDSIAPGMLWHREWETKATQLVESLR